MNCGGGAAGGIPVAPGAAFAVPAVKIGVDANRDGVIEPNETAVIVGAGGGGGVIDNDTGDDCVRQFTTYKTVQVPCTRNKYRVVNYQVPQTVPYTDWQTVTKMRPTTKLVPTTRYFPTTEVVPYQTQEPVTKYKTIQIPKSTTQCYPVTSIVKKQIPVVNVVPINGGRAPPCPPDSVLNPQDAAGVAGLGAPMTGPGGLSGVMGLGAPMTGPGGMAGVAGLGAPMTGPGGLSGVIGLGQPMTGPGGCNPAPPCGY